MGGTGINPAGAISGYYIDTREVAHGFLRSPDGTITTFDAPGAGGFLNGTFPRSINPAGVITGYFSDTNNHTHGFVRDADGTITTFDPGPLIYIRANSINQAGVITGYFVDANSTSHGLIREKNDALTIFDVPDSSAAFRGTVASGINPAGTVAGYHYPTNTLSPQAHGFVREKNGASTSFDVPTGTDTFATSINPDGVVTGFYRISLV